MPPVTRTCECDGIPYALLKDYDTPFGEKSRLYYGMGFGCTLKTKFLPLNETEDAWVLEFPGTLVAGDDPVTLRATLTISGTEPGQVIVELVNTEDGDKLIGKWENDELFEAHRDCEMHLLYHDPEATNLRWKMRECLRPGRGNTCGRYGLIGRQKYFVLQVPTIYLMLSISDRFDAGDETIEVGRISEFDLYLEATKNDLGSCWYEGSREFSVDINYCEDGSCVTLGTVKITAWIGSGNPDLPIVGDGSVGFLVEFTGFGLDSSTDPPDLGGVVGIYAVVNSTDPYTSYPWLFGVIGSFKPEEIEPFLLNDPLHGEFNLTRTIPEGFPDYIITAVLPEDDPDELRCKPDKVTVKGPCLGTASGFLRRKHCPEDEEVIYTYWWEVNENSCEGSCNSGGGCRPVPPYELVEGANKFNDEDAIIFGIDLDDIDQSVAWECGCVDPVTYTEPACAAPCEGFCQYTIAGYTSSNGSFGTLAGTLTIIITDTGIMGGTVIGYVYLNVSANYCGSPCACTVNEKYYTEIGYWGVGGFPSNSFAVGNIGGSWDCE